MAAMRRRGAMLVLTLASIGAAQAGTVYRWTDERGVVHFADVPPAAVRTYTTEQLPDAPPPPPQADQPPAAAEAGAPTPGSSGPARVVITERADTPLGGSTQSFSGEVTNEGGREAHDVAVAIRVVEPSQGELCVDGRIDVEPPTLGPGASGRFSAEFDSPCFLGPTQTELVAEWD